MAAELVLGSFGLAGLFSTCTECFRLVRIARSRHEDFAVCQTLLDNQLYHLDAWARACGLTDPTKSNWRFNDPLAKPLCKRISITLETIRDLAVNTQKLRNEYGVSVRRTTHRLLLELSADGPPPSRSKHVLAHAKDVRDAALKRKVQLTKSIFWAIGDREKFRSLIDELTKLIGDLDKFTTKDNASFGSSGVLAGGRWRALKERITLKLSRKSRARLAENKRPQLSQGGTNLVNPRSTAASGARFNLLLSC